MCAIFCCSILLWLFWQVKATHPYEGSYLNEAVRLALPKQRLSAYFDFYSWGTPLNGAIKWLNSNVPNAGTVQTLEGDYPAGMIPQYPLRTDIKYMIKKTRWDPEQRIPIYSLKCYGENLVTVYSYDNNTYELVSAEYLGLDLGLDGAPK